MTSKPPNIILIVLDTVGAKHLSLYGYQRRTTPNLERIAEECMVYNRCFAPACWTIPSHASMFTGLYPSQHGAYEGSFMLNDNVQHLSAVLKMAGYRTLGISSNGLVGPGSGLLLDFDYFKDFGDGAFKRLLGTNPQDMDAKVNAFRQQLRKGIGLRELTGIYLKYLMETRQVMTGVKMAGSILQNEINKVINPTPSSKSSKFSEATVSLCRQIIDEHGGKGNEPFLLFINLLEAHEKYRPPLRWRKFSHWHDRQTVGIGRFYGMDESSRKAKILAKYRNLYDDEICYTDDIVSRIWELFKKSDIFNNTVFIITSDHGEHLGEKGHYSHMLSLYNELLWVPLLIRYPRDFRLKGADDRLLSLTDIYSTILDLIGSPLPRPLTSFSLLNHAQRELAVAQILYPEWFRVQLEAKQQVCEDRGVKFSPPVFAVITAGGLKIIMNRDESLQAYDLRQNMDEENDLIPGAAPEVRENFREMIAELKKETGFLDISEVISNMQNNISPLQNNISPEGI